MLCVQVLDGGDYKDDKAKVHEMKSGSSKKDLQERRHRTQAKKNFNLGKIGTAASRRDPGMAMVSFDDEEQDQSEPLLNEKGDVYSEALQSQEDDNDGLQLEESELQHDDEDLNSCGNDSSRAMVSLDDVEGEVEVSNLFASAQGSKQALSKVRVC